MPKRVKRTTGAHERIQKLEKALETNALAIQEGPRKKKWTLHDLKDTKPLTENQTEVFQNWFEGMHIIMHGTAGTGKTYVGMYLGLTSVLDPKQHPDKLIIVRSVVPTREIGYLPGTLEEKQAAYENPYRDIMCDLIGKWTSYDDMKQAGVVQFVSTSFLRGLTWDNAIIIIDEAQNLTLHEFDTVLTRAGHNSRIIVCGDTRQNDINGKCGMQQFLEISKDMPREFARVQFNKYDIVRGEFVKAWIIASERVSI